MRQSNTGKMAEKIEAEANGRMVVVYKRHGEGVVVVLRTYVALDAARRLVRHPSWWYSVQSEREGCEMYTGDYGVLCDYYTAESIAEATREQRDASREAAERDGGAGVIDVDGRSCYVEE